MLAIGIMAFATYLCRPMPANSASSNTDLTASGFLFLPTAIAPGAHPEFTAFVLQNKGPDALLDNTVSYEFFLSRTPIFDAATAIRFGGLNDTLRLGAGEHAAIILTDADLNYLSIPLNAAGSYYVFVHVQAAAISDQYPANNLAMRAGIIAVGGVSPATPVSADFDGDRKADPTIYQNGKWQVKLSATAYATATATLGGSGCQPLDQDFDGDGKSDPAVYEETTGNWAVMLSATGYSSASLARFGGVGYVQVAADYDGDGKADPAIYEEVTHAADSGRGGTWQIKLSGSGYATATLADFGGYGYSALAADFDGDGKADPAIYEKNSGNWQVKLSGSDYTTATVSGFGDGNYQPLAGMFDLDTRADAAVYNRVSGTWRIMLSADDLYNITIVPNFGGSGYTAVVGDFDGDRLADPAVYNAAASAWDIMLSASGYDTTIVRQ